MYFRSGDGASIYYEDYGRGRPIVLIPGFMCSSRFFYRNIEGLSQRNRLILMDPRGHGNSSKTLEGHTVEMYARDIGQLLDYLDLRDVFLLGWSMAGQTVLHYAHIHENHRLSALGIMDCLLKEMHPKNVIRPQSPGMEVINSFLKTSYADYEGYCRRFAEIIWRKIDTNAIEWTVKEFLKTPPWIACAIYSDRAFRSSCELLPHIRLPVLFLGADSEVIPNGKILAAQDYPNHMHPAVRREAYTFNQGGHVFFHANPEEFNRVVLDFFDATA
jgi:pimeloyl-ACP methyl ester carboxylesterase